VYDNSGYAFPYFVKMTENCLDENAQFRYLESQLLHNIEKNGTLVSSRQYHNYYNRWSVYKGETLEAKKYQQNTKHRLKQRAAGSVFFYERNEKHNTCAEPSSTSPTYLQSKKCIDKSEKQKFTFGK
jgi:hypothetical protein